VRCPDETVTALMPVHRGVHHEHLSQAVGSVLAQTRLPNEFVIVEDGPLAQEQVSVLDGITASLMDVKRVRLAVNSGAGVANQAGLAVATGDWVMKVDADDVNLPDRLERQLAAAVARGLDVCGAAMLEFADDPSHATGVRRTPIEHEDIARRMQWNNPVNHPTSLYRRAAALAAGGYGDLRFMQDYDMFARMLVGGARMGNLPEPTVLFRADDSMSRRRKGLAILRTEWTLQRRLRRYGLLSRPRLVLNLLVRGGFRLLPAPFVAFVLRKVMSRRSGTDG
jgi:glycosyltransferase involved in cell wall biosynthesis